MVLLCNHVGFFFSRKQKLASGSDVASHLFYRWQRGIQFLFENISLSLPVIVDEVLLVAVCDALQTSSTDICKYKLIFLPEAKGPRCRYIPGHHE